MYWSKLFTALVLFGLAVVVVGLAVALLLSPLLTRLPALAVLALVAVSVGIGSFLGAGAVRRRRTPYW